MTAEFGLFFLILALLVALVQASYLIPRARALVAPCLPSAALLQAFLILLSFVTLMVLRIDSDFSVVAVAANSNLTLPTLYKIAGTWGNHEGSMLLWVLVLALFGAALAIKSPLPNPLPCTGEGNLKQSALAVQSAVCAGFLLFILLTSNPFARVFPPPPDGEALNPLLQDIGLSIHPPLLYLGYVGFGIVFSLAVAALFERKIDREWAALAHPWIMAAWSALTFGIGLGSWWAYRTLGWGGFWFWDPVENVSLLPWLSGTALLHSNMVLKKRGMLGSWVILLAILTFGLSLIGTFLVRSGVLSSVHSFASDPARGLFILGYSTVVIGGALLLFALRGGAERQEKILPLSREGMIVVNNLFLLTACATVLLGTTYPIFAEWLSGERLSVGAPYFNATFLPLMVLPLLLAGFALYLPWQKADLSRVWCAIKPALLAMLTAAMVALAVIKKEAALAALGFSMAVWLIIASAQWINKGRAAAIPAGLAHLGAAVLLLGITGMGLWQQEAERPLAVGEAFDIDGRRMHFDSLSDVRTPNYAGHRAQFTFCEGTQFTPEYRLYNIRGTAASVPAISHSLTGDLYVVIGETSQGRTAVRAYSNPLVTLIWAGCVLMAVGGIMSIILGRRRGNFTI